MTCSSADGVRILKLVEWSQYYDDRIWKLNLTYSSDANLREPEISVKRGRHERSATCGGASLIRHSQQSRVGVFPCIIIKLYDSMFLPQYDPS
jgi:hypothetical protein